MPLNDIQRARGVWCQNSADQKVKMSGEKGFFNMEITVFSHVMFESRDWVKTSVLSQSMHWWGSLKCAHRQCTTFIDAKWLWPFINVWHAVVTQHSKDNWITPKQITWCAQSALGLAVNPPNVFKAASHGLTTTPLPRRLWIVRTYSTNDRILMVRLTKGGGGETNKSTVRGGGVTWHWGDGARDVVRIWGRCRRKKVHIDRERGRDLGDLK